MSGRTGIFVAAAVALLLAGATRAAGAAQWNEHPRVVRARQDADGQRSRPPALSTPSLWGKTNLLADPEIRIHDLITVVRRIAEGDVKTSPAGGSAGGAQRGSKRNESEKAVKPRGEDGDESGPNEPIAALKPPMNPTKPERARPREDEDAGNPDHDTKRDDPGGFHDAAKMQYPIAARVIEVLPNGNLVIEARREIRGEGRTRVVRFAGEVDRRDVSDERVVRFDRVADARVWTESRAAAPQGRERETER